MFAPLRCYLGKRFFFGPGPFIGTLVGQSIVKVCERYNARCKRNLFPLKRARVTGAVPFFMMRVRNRLGQYQELEGTAVQYAETDSGVRLHPLKFMRFESSGLEQNIIRDADLADIMQGCCRMNHADFLFGKTQSLGD